MFQFLNIRRTIIILTAIFVLFPAVSFAATLYLEPVEAQYYQGDSFITGIRIDAEDECINTIEANLSFSKDVLEVIDFSQGNSILTLWLKSPTIDQNSGLISFIGGIPGGYCGKLPGDPGESNLLGRIVFQVKEINRGPSSAKLEFLESSQILLNDGFGTPAKLSTKGAVFTILSGIPETPKKEWQEELSKDIIPPEPFELEINKDPSIFESKYFIIFSTNDKQTGIDRYEILETRGKKKEIWKIGESPYLLEDQALQSIIKVKAVDKAGNERIAEYLPPLKPKPFPYWLIILVLIGIGIGYWLYRKSKTELPFMEAKVKKRTKSSSPFKNQNDK